MKEGTEIKLETFWLGTAVTRFNLPIELVDEINKAYDENSENLKPFNDNLAGKIVEQNLVSEILTDETKDIFRWCFRTYLEITNNLNWNPVLAQAWINEMRAGEYNPLHYHESSDADIGLSSVLMLKRPDCYGVEASWEQNPLNGRLEFTSGNQSEFSTSQVRADAQVGEFYIFPFTLLHIVYPFNSTDEVRRTLSYNCNLFRKGK